jgi:hypothetical protein
VKRTCIVCGGKFLADVDERLCPTDRRWNDRQQRREPLPPPSRVAAAASQSDAGERPGKTPHVVAARHPSQTRWIDYPCYPHNERSALNCPRCQELGERDWHDREEPWA